MSIVIRRAQPELRVVQRPISVVEYHRMAETGIIAPDERVELLSGAIIAMSPIGPLHAAVVDRVAEQLRALSTERAIVRVQNPVTLDDESEPQPDIALLRRRADFYANGHPTPQDILLLVEVSDTTLEYDRDVKLPRYAAADIPEVWIVDLRNQQVECHASPRAGVYRERHIVADDELLRSPYLAGAVLSAAEVLGGS